MSGLEPQDGLIQLPGSLTGAWWLKVALRASILPALLITFFLGSSHYPRVQPSTSEVAAQIVSILEEGPAIDSELSGDYLVERYYGVDLNSGQRVVGDVIRGRIVDVIVELKYDWTVYTYSLLLDRSNVESERDEVRRIVSEVAPAPSEDGVRYVGLVGQSGPVELFSLNYDGSLPQEALPFAGPAQESVYEFLGQQVFPEVAANSRILEVEDNNFSLTTTSQVWEFPRYLGVSRAVLVGRQILVDVPPGAP